MLSTSLLLWNASFHSDLISLPLALLHSLFLFSSALEPKPKHLQSSGIRGESVQGRVGWKTQIQPYAEQWRGEADCFPSAYELLLILGQPAWLGWWWEWGLAEFRESTCRTSKTAVLLRREDGEESGPEASANVIVLQGKVGLELLVGSQCSSAQGNFALQGRSAMSGTFLVVTLEG